MVLKGLTLHLIPAAVLVFCEGKVHIALTWCLIPGKLFVGRRLYQAVVVALPVREYIQH
ncbi:hypothetical protein E2C01_002218 [Portunus trituberculatus]|uniref:Secreted protein n=1 Tax=Portunus trituberculatus TaxID=210409 RepID=A0A5B7CLM9_PORTR|nr:hypothetical protein [Portunus trituberculatus]